MKIVVITGLSGSGKSNALRALEDIGYYAIDNLPIRLLDKLVELFSSTSGEVQKLALVVDARMAGMDGTHQTLAHVPSALEATRAAGHDVDLVFLEASESALARRYIETRRRHPLSTDGSVEAGVAVERTLLEPLSQSATATIDTTQLSVHDLKREMQHAFSAASSSASMSVTVMSFGYKYGVPSEANLMFDVRFLPNPYFIEELRAHSGKEEPVATFVMKNEDTGRFLDHTTKMLEFLLPRYEAEGKAYLTIAIGCTGGRHRSVAIAEELGRRIEAEGRRVQLRHRDVGR